MFRAVNWNLLHRPQTNPMSGSMVLCNERHRCYGMHFLNVLAVSHNLGSELSLQ